MGESGSYSDGRGHARKSLIQFAADRWGCVPALWFGLGQTTAGVMAVIATSFKSACARAIVAPNKLFCLCYILGWAKTMKIGVLYGTETPPDLGLDFSFFPLVSYQYNGS